VLADFCRRWRIVSLSLFGSVLTEDFDSQSDIDFVVDFSKDSRHSLLDLIKMETELSQLLNRKVDLMTKASLHRSKNAIRKNAILKSLTAYYDQKH